MVAVNPRVWRRWAEQESSVGILIKGVPNSESSQAIVEDVVASLDLLDQDGQLMAEMVAQRSVAGPGVWIANCLAEHWRPTIDRLVQGLQAAGLEPTEITVLPVTRPLRGQYEGLAAIKAFFALRGNRPPTWKGPIGWPFEEPDWILPDPVRQTCLDALVLWALTLPGAEDTAAVATGMYFTPVPLEGVYPMMHAAAQSRVSLQTNMLAVTAGKRFRSVKLSLNEGLAYAAEGVTDPAVFDWSSSLAELTSILAGAGEWADYGHLTRAAGGLWNFQPEHGTGQAVSHLSGTTAIRQAEVEGHLYDAFGVFATRADSLVDVPAGGQWRADRQGRLTLYTHEDLAAWYADELIDPTVLAAARAALSQHLRP